MKKINCPACEGRGYYVRVVHSAIGEAGKHMTCKRCHGEGIVMVKEEATL
jgi:DnaJ-class molecular chaperone